MSPLVCITGNLGEKGCELAQGYYASVLAAGGVPVVIPPYEDEDALRRTLDGVDALLLSGGGDLNPLLVGEEPIPTLRGVCPQRDAAEMRLVRMAMARQMPILGICRGMQVLAAVQGGTLYQDLGVQYADAPLLKHSQDMPREYASHSIRVESGSLLEKIFSPTESTEAAIRLNVNSFHHQAVRTAGNGLRICAWAADGVAEALESTEHKNVLGVQWHPECFWLRGDEGMMPIFRWLVSEAAVYARARDFHRQVLTLDSHCDTPMWFCEKREDNARMFGEGSDRVLVDIPKMSSGMLDASVMVAYLPQGERTEQGHREAAAMADRLLTQMDQMVQDNEESACLAYTAEDLYRAKRMGKKAVMKGIENGYAIGRDISLISHFRQRGVVYMTLCHNGDNEICDSARGNAEHGGLSPFGADVVREMNRVGMMVDLSHAAEKSFYDVLDLSIKPVVCSHSSTMALCAHPRNLTDHQLRALADRGGVAQMTLYAGFLRTDAEADIRDAVEHLNHMVQVMGVEHVGFGSDFDGDGGVPGIASAAEVINFTCRLLKNRYSEADLRLIWGENFLRVMRQVQGKT